MPASEARAQGIAARLSDLGLATRVEEHVRYTSDTHRSKRRYRKRCPPNRGGRSWKWWRRPIGSDSSPAA